MTAHHLVEIGIFIAVVDPGTGLSMEERDLIKELDELLKPTDPPKEAALKNTAETLSPNSLKIALL